MYTVCAQMTSFDLDDVIMTSWRQDFMTHERTAIHTEYKKLFLF